MADQMIQIEMLAEDIIRGNKTPILLNETARLQCIQYMLCKSIKKEEIAKLMKMSPRHLRRKVSVLNKQFTFELGKDWLKRAMVGLFQSYMDDDIFFLKKSQDNGATITEQLQARYLRSRMRKEHFGLLMAMGCITPGAVSELKEETSKFMVTMVGERIKSFSDPVKDLVMPEELRTEVDAVLEHTRQWQEEQNNNMHIAQKRYDRNDLLESIKQCPQDTSDIS